MASHILYRVYYSLMMSDIFHKQGLDATEQNKRDLHEFHKKILGYQTTEGISDEIMSLFLFEVACYWAVEHGIFVRTNKNQPYNIENMPLKDVWNLL